MPELRLTAAVRSPAGRRPSTVEAPPVNPRLWAAGPRPSARASFRAHSRHPLFPARPAGALGPRPGPALGRPGRPPPAGPLTRPEPPPAQPAWVLLRAPWAAGPLAGRLAEAAPLAGPALRPGVPVRSPPSPWLPPSLHIRLPSTPLSCSACAPGPKEKDQGQEGQSPKKVSLEPQHPILWISPRTSSPLVSHLERAPGWGIRRPPPHGLGAALEGCSTRTMWKGASAAQGQAGVLAASGLLQRTAGVGPEPGRSLPPISRQEAQLPYFGHPNGAVDQYQSVPELCSLFHTCFPVS